MAGMDSVAALDAARLDLRGEDDAEVEGVSVLSFFLIVVPAAATFLPLPFADFDEAIVAASANSTVMRS
jgi:hypothetical protein